MNCDKCDGHDGTHQITLLNSVHTKLCPDCRTDFDVYFQDSPEVQDLNDASARYNCAAMVGDADTAITYGRKTKAMRPKLRELVYEWLDADKDRVTVELCSACARKTARD